MADSLDFKTFDIADMFAGITYPKTVVPFYTDSGVAYEFHRLTQESVEAVQSKDEAKAKDIAKRREELIKKSEAHRYEFHLTGRSREDREAVLDAVTAEFPPEVDPLFGREKPNPEADKVYVNRFWAIHIEKIVRPDGAVLLVDEATIRTLRGKSPDPELAKVEAAIQELSEGAKSGFESLAQEHDFLSSASAEA